jgi:isopentenyl-diphosphate Delta-isomerase
MPTPPDNRSAPYHTAQRHSIDNPGEVFDLIDLDDRVIGQVRRGEAHRDPALVHRSVQILLFASDGRLLLQRRSAAKDLFPGYFCASASGHVVSGDDYGATAARELEEELGLAAPLKFVGKMLVRSEPETEMTALYIARSDGPYTFHPTETDGGQFLSLAEVEQGMEQGNLAVTPALRAAIEELVRLLRPMEGGLGDLLSRLG